MPKPLCRKYNLTNLSKEWISIMICDFLMLTYFTSCPNYRSLNCRKVIGSSWLFVCTLLLIVWWEKHMVFTHLLGRLYTYIPLVAVWTVLCSFKPIFHSDICSECDAMIIWDRFTRHSYLCIAGQECVLYGVREQTALLNHLTNNYFGNDNCKVIHMALHWRTI